MLRMYVSQPENIANKTILNTESSYADFERAESQELLAKTNSRTKVNKANSKESLSESDYNLTKSNVGGKTGSTLVDFNLTKTAKAKLPTGKTLKKSDVEVVANIVNREQVDDIYSALAQVQLKNNNISKQISEQYSCEDAKLLEVILEHILIHWDDITAVLIDEIIQEEAFELNKIETKRNPEPVTSQLGLADRSMHGKFHDF